MASRTVTITLAGNSKSAEDAIGKVSGALGKVAKPAALAAAGIGAAAVAIGGKAVANAAKLEKGLAEVRTLLPEISDEGFGQMKDKLLEFSNEMGIATDKAVPALYQAISAGVPQDNVFEFMEIAGKAAAGGVTDLETAVDGLSSVVNAYGPDMISASEASDIMFTAVKLGKTNFEELSSSINQVAPIASAMGIKFEEVAAAATTLTTTGVPTTEAMTKVRAMMQSLTAPSEQAKKLFDELGISVDQNRLANEGFAPVLQEIMEKTGGNVDQLKKMFGSVEALQAAMTLAKDEGAVFKDILGEMENSTGATGEAFETMADTSAFKFEQAQVKLNNTLTKVGGMLLPAVSTALDAVSGALDWLLPKAEALVKNLLEELTPAWNDHIKPALSAVVGIIKDDVIPQLEKIGNVAFKVIETAWNEVLKPALDALKKIFDEAIVPVIRDTVIPLIKEIGEKAFKRVETLWNDTLKPAINEIMDLFGGSEDSGSSTLSGVINVLKKTFETVFNVVGVVIDTAHQLVAQRIAWIINTIKGIISFLVNIFQGDFQGAWDAIKGIVSDTWDAIKDTINIAIDLVKRIFDVFGIDIEGIFKGIWDKIESTWNSFKSFFTETIPNGFKEGVNLIIGALEGIPNAFISGMNSLIRVWNDFSLSSPEVKDPIFGKTIIPSITMHTPDIPLIPKVSIPRLARGGIVPATPGGTLIRAGEAGKPEAIIPLDDQFGGAGGPRNVRVRMDVRVTIQGGIVMVDDFIRDIAPHLVEEMNIAMQRGDIDLQAST